MKNNVLFLPLIAILLSCSNKVEVVEKSFYYWKSENSLFTENEDTLISKLGVEKLYIKFFEIKNDESLGNIPISKSELGSYDYNKLSDRLKKISIIPTVYIQNKVFINSTRAEIDLLATNTNYLLNKYYQERFSVNKSMATEYQMDCDWTIKSKDNYFYFLKKLKSLSNIKLSCTLRLYPYKYPKIMGLPPVDKATLMCYNLINPLENHNKNSILDLDELKSYLNVKTKYPIHLDIALPIYSWMQVYQNNNFVRVLYDDNEEIKAKTLNKTKEPLWFDVINDTTINDFYLRIGDKIKYEDMNYLKVKKAIDIIKSNVNFDQNTTVTLFHLDENQLKKYTNEEISNFYNSFSK